MDMKKIVKEIEGVLIECGNVMLTADRSPAMIEEKSGHANFVTTYDKKVQYMLQDKLCKIFPEAVFVGEEDDIRANIEKGYAFIVDPIDGTTNFIRDYKVSCISVGITKDGRSYAGVVYNPYLKETFWAIEGEGAYLNDKPIHVSSHPLENAVVLFGTAPYYTELHEDTFTLAYECFKRSLDLRRSGSAALDLCNVACGRAELFFELKLQTWDYAAGAIIIKEAGGKITTVDHKEITLDRPCSILATNGLADINWR